MASRFEDDTPDVKECGIMLRLSVLGGCRNGLGNCGAVDGLMRCSRCRSIYFCSAKCQKAYWPFHKSSCTRNEFADLIDRDDPKFAKWMRHHGKLATLKDAEIDRIERARRAMSGPDVHTVMDSMFNKLDPGPTPPSYNAEELKKMKSVPVVKSQEDAWSRLDTSFGLDCSTYKWRQNLSHVELFVKIPFGVGAQKVHVIMEPLYLSVSWEEDPFIAGELLNEIVSTESYWFVSDHILTISMLKKSRKGHYAVGHTNADTFWNRILRSSHFKETLTTTTTTTETTITATTNTLRVPKEYYLSFYEADDLVSESRLRLKTSHDMHQKEPLMASASSMSAPTTT